MPLTAGDRPSAPGAFREFLLALLRIAIGWHFFYEGFAKLLHPAWTSAGFLKGTGGPLAAVFHWLAADAARVWLVDQANIWGLMAIGLALMLGLAVRAAAVAGMFLLALYYLAYPPLFSLVMRGFTEGSYLVVNKNLIELCALAVIAASPATVFGLQSLWERKRSAAAASTGQESAPRTDRLVPSFLGPMSRRHVLASMAGMPFLGGLVLAILRKHGWKSFEEVPLRSKANGKDIYLASATVKTFQFVGLNDLRGRLPYARIGGVQLSRMILGGNLIGGWAHARDLIYVSKLVKAYHHREKIFETLALAERCGVNTVLTNPLLCGVINDYWRNGGRIQFISDCGGKDVLAMIQQSIDAGACACYVQGGVADRLVEEGQFDLMAKSLELIRRNGMPAGIGAHKLATVRACAERGLRPDFWMKTLHHVNYWSATPAKQHDNIWCEEPEDTVAYMRQLREPWIAFKVLAAGAIEPKVGFQYAFESGADFICVGMYDFQIVEDVNLAADILNRPLVRRREWCA
jgi:uncharacterized membrane protein YphA (DoxX/SURF4 family)